MKWGFCHPVTMDIPWTSEVALRDLGDLCHLVSYWWHTQLLWGGRVYKRHLKRKWSLVLEVQLDEWAQKAFKRLLSSLTQLHSLLQTASHHKPWTGLLNGSVHEGFWFMKSHKPQTFMSLNFPTLLPSLVVALSHGSTLRVKWKSKFKLFWVPAEDKSRV